MTTKKPEQMRAEDWTSHFPHGTTDVKLPKHLKRAATQIRNLEYRILEAERLYKECVEKLYDVVIRHDNLVYVGLGEDVEAVVHLWHFLCGLRRAHEVICGNGRLC
jgi:hypothetical protein